ncbi:hypothetical protein A3743_23010 [Oleiphilus sp. HI0072]|nr:hypothetical protein A3743_23010 [Oleiphilus sp. HI0072]
MAVTAATIYMSLMGYKGLSQVAMACHQNTQKLRAKLEAIDGVSVLNGEAFFHELVVQVDNDADAVLESMAEQGVLAGYGLEQHFDALKNCILVCVTEVKNDADLDLFANALSRALAGGEA